MTRGIDDLLADLADAADAAAELVRLGTEHWDTDACCVWRGEAVIGRRGDIATKLPDAVIKATPEIPCGRSRASGSSPRTLIIESTMKRSGPVCATTSREWIRRSITGARPKLDRARYMPKPRQPYARRGRAWRNPGDRVSPPSGTSLAGACQTLRSCRARAQAVGRKSVRAGLRGAHALASIGA